MAFSKNETYRKYARLFFLTFTVSVAVALSACSKGFKLKDPSKNSSTSGPGTANITVPINTLSYEPLLEMAVTASPEIAEMARSGKTTVTSSTLNFSIHLDSQGLSVPGSSLLYLTISVKGADGKESATIVTSNRADIALTAPSDVEIGGYWTIDRPGKTHPFYIGLNSKVVLKGNGVAHLAGTVFANFTGENLQTLNSFDENLCSMTVDPWNWAHQYFEDSSFNGCVTAPSSNAPTTTQDASIWYDY